MKLIIPKRRDYRAEFEGIDVDYEGIFGGRFRNPFDSDRKDRYSVGVFGNQDSYGGIGILNLGKEDNSKLQIFLAGDSSFVKVFDELVLENIPNSIRVEEENGSLMFYNAFVLSKDKEELERYLYMEEMPGEAKSLASFMLNLIDNI